MHAQNYIKTNTPKNHMASIIQAILRQMLTLQPEMSLMPHYKTKINEFL